MTLLRVIFALRRALIINERSHRIPLISWTNEVFIMEGSCPAAGASGDALMQAHICKNLGEKKSCDVKKNNRRRQIFL